MIGLEWIAAGASLAAAVAAVTIAYLAARRTRSSDHTMELIVRSQDQLIDELTRAVKSSTRSSGVLGNDRTTYSLLRAINRLSDNISASAESRAEHPDGGREASEVSVIGLDQVVAEISHSLNTPLQQIELTLDYLREHVEAGRSPGAIPRAQESVDLCRAVLSAYRDVAGFSRLESDWDIGDLGKSVAGALSIIIQAHGNDTITVDVAGPTKIEGYSNYFILAVVLPLLENAVEASRERESIVFRVGEFESQVVISVRNSLRESRNLQDLNRVGFTSKEKDSSGLGLASVRTLLMRRRGQLTFDLDEDEFLTVRINLPARIEVD